MLEMPLYNYITMLILKILILFSIPTFAVVHTFLNFGNDIKFIQEIGLFYFSFLILSIGSLLIAEKYFNKTNALIFISITIFSIAFFSFLPVNLHFSESRLRIKLLIWLTFTSVTLVVVLWQFRKWPLTVTFTLVCLMYTSLLPNLHTNYSFSIPWKEDKLPNVYFLMPDSYASSDSYSKYYGYNNSTFVSFLEHHEFHVSKKVFVNYPVTTLAVSSMLDARLFLTMGDNALTEPANYEPVYRRLRGNNESANFFTSRGYNYIQFFPGVNCDTLVTYCLGEKLQYTQATKNFLKLSFLDSLISSFDFQKIGLKKIQFKPNMHDIKVIQTFLENGYKSNKPFFLFGRILPPHDGNTYGRDCVFKAPMEGKLTTGFKGAKKFDKAKYISDTKCTELDLTALVRQILSSDQDAIIVIQSDGGPHALNQFDKPYLNWTKTDIYSRFSSFRAIRANSKYKACIESGIKKTVTTVNTLEIIMSCLSGRKPKLADDISFFATYPDRPDHGKVLPILIRGKLVKNQ